MVTNSRPRPHHLQPAVRPRGSRLPSMRPCSRSPRRNRCVSPANPLGSRRGRELRSGRTKTKDREFYQQRISHEQYARQRFLDSIRLPDGREGYTKLAIVGGGPNPCRRPSFRGGAESATDRYSWFMFGGPWRGNRRDACTRYRPRRQTRKRASYDLETRDRRSVQAGRRLEIN